MSTFLDEAQKILDENWQRRMDMLGKPFPEKSERFTVIADLDKTSFFRDVETPATDLEDEWKAEIVNMSEKQFAQFMTWIWRDTDEG